MTENEELIQNLITLAKDIYEDDISSEDIIFLSENINFQWPSGYQYYDGSLYVYPLKSDLHIMLPNPADINSDENPKMLSFNNISRDHNFYIIGNCSVANRSNDMCINVGKLTAWNRHSIGGSSYDFSIDTWKAWTIFPNVD